MMQVVLVAIAAIIVSAIAAAIFWPKTVSSSLKVKAITWESDVKSFFRKKDIDAMSARGMDLSDKKVVSDNANEIYARVADGTMPCDEPWSQKRIDAFGQWIAQGKK